MRIEGVRWMEYRLPFRAPYLTASGRLAFREGLLLQLVAEDGRTGLGEAAPAPESRVTGRDLGRVLAAAAPRLLGQDAAGLGELRLPEGCAAETAAAIRGALDIALCDLLAQEQGVSVARLLSAAAQSVVVNALVTAAAGAPARARAALAAGFAVLKLKVGTLPTPEAERRRVAAVRRAVGPEVKLRLDANGAWTAEQAIATLRSLLPYGIEFVEQPVAAGRPQALARVRAATGAVVAADEDVTGPAAARRLVELGAADVLVLKPQRLGGLRACRAIAQAAAAAGVPCVVTTSIEAGVGTAAALHLAAALGGPFAHGLATLELLADDLILGPGLPAEGGVMRVPESPGLGVRLDEAALARAGAGWQEARA